MDKKTEIKRTEDRSHYVQSTRLSGAWSRVQRVLTLRQDAPSLPPATGQPTPSREVAEVDQEKIDSGSRPPSLTRGLTAGISASVSSAISEAQVMSANIHVLRILDAAINNAPPSRMEWAIRLRLREDALSQCSLSINASPDEIFLRFCSAELETQNILSIQGDMLKTMLSNLLGRKVSVEIKKEYFGFV